MTLVKWTPGRRYLTPFTVDSWLDNIDHLFGSFTGWPFHLPAPDRAHCFPSFNLMENDKEYVIRVEAPGMTKSDFNVRVKDGLLTVSGDKKAEESKENEQYTYRGSLYGRFSRSFRLPDDVIQKKVKANYKDGVLTIWVPRSKPVEEKPIEVEIS